MIRFVARVISLLSILALVVGIYLMLPSDVGADEVMYVYNSLNTKASTAEALQAARSNKEAFKDGVYNNIGEYNSSTYVFPVTADCEADVGMNAGVGWCDWYYSGEKKYYHEGVDIFPFNGVDSSSNGIIVSPVSGCVTIVSTTLNKKVRVVSEDNSYYFDIFHCRGLYDGITEGQHVQAGDKIAYVGMSGYANGFPHAHFEAHINDSTIKGTGTLVNPFSFEVVSKCSKQEYDTLPSYSGTPSVKYSFDSNVRTVYIPPYGEYAPRVVGNLLIDDMKFATLQESMIVTNSSNHKPIIEIAGRTYNDEFPKDKSSVFKE